MKFFLFAVLIIVVFIIVGCSRDKQTSSVSTPIEQTPRDKSDNLFAFEFYYYIPSLGTYDLLISPSENGAQLVFNSTHDSHVIANKRVDESIVTELTLLLDKYDVYSWDGFETYSDKEVLETKRFSMLINYGGGDMLIADGREEFPENFYDFYDELHKLTLTAALMHTYTTPLSDGIDYSKYATLIEQKKQEYGSLTTAPTYSYEDVDLHETYGVVYTHLLDLDNNGVLELIIVSAKKGELSYENRFNYSDNNIEIYTIIDKSELHKVGEIPLLMLPSKHLSGSAEYAVNYAFIDTKGYIGTGTEANDTHKQYISYNPDGLNPTITLSALLIPDVGTSFSIDNESVEIEEFKEAYYNFEQHAITHSVSGILLQELEWINKINEQTNQFLSEYFAS